MRLCSTLCVSTASLRARQWTSWTACEWTWGLTVHQTTHVLKVVRSLRWKVRNHIPEHPAHPNEEYAHYPPTELPNSEATPVPGATKVTALQAVRAVKA